MIRFLLLFYLTLFQQAEPIKAISYNIRYNNPKDGINVWENRRETVASLLKEENADFVGLQEVVYPQLNDLIKEMIKINPNLIKSISYVDSLKNHESSSKIKYSKL